MASFVSRRILATLGALSLVCNACGGSPGGAASTEGDGDVDEPDVSGPAGGSDGGGSNEGGSGGAGSGGVGSGNGGSETVASAGCDRAPALSSGEQSIEVDGVTRTFIVDVPSDYDESTPYPLLFGFHGRGFSAAEFRSASYGNLLSVAGEEAVVVHPDALGEPESFWDVESLDDVRF